MVCGEFKRGKSTFINALLDMSLCPTDEHIATSTVSIIKYGEKQKVTRFYDTEDGVKEEIIEYYVNDSALGGGCYGVEEASKYYFGKSVSDLNLAEKFLLVRDIIKTFFLLISVVYQIHYKMSRKVS